MIKEIASTINYKGFTVDIQKDNDGFFWIIYSPDIDKDLDSKYNKGRNAGIAIQNSKHGIDEHLKRKGK